MKTVLTLLLMTQLIGPNFTIPQVMSARASAAGGIKAGQKAAVTVSLILRKGYKINREPAITLTLTPVAGVNLESTTIEAPSEDKQSTDEYFVNLPTLRFAVTAARAGRYELPGKLTYFFCSKTDGFCSKQTADVKIPLQVE